MLELTIPETEMWDAANQEFINTKEQTRRQEHSLHSLSKWQSKWGKPFLAKDYKTNEEIVDYIKCMTLTRNVPDVVYLCLTNNDIIKVDKYIDAPMTATWFNDDEKSKKKGREQVTSELIYYWMIALNIPFECQKWHLNRLITLIKVCNIKNQSPKNMSKRDIMSRNAALNAARRKKFNTKG